MPTLGHNRDTAAIWARIRARRAYEAKIEAKGVLRGSTKWIELTCRWHARN